MIPVMIWGRLILGKRYNLTDYLVAMSVTAGCTLFLMTGEVHSSAAKKSADTSLYGMFLMCGYLGFDGFTSTFQDKLFKGYHMETYNQMLYVTMCSAAVSAFWLMRDSAMYEVRSVPPPLAPHWSLCCIHPRLSAGSTLAN